MTAIVRRWTRERRYRALVRELQSLPASELRALGIAPAQINRLEAKVVQAEGNELPPSDAWRNRAC